MDKSAMIAYGVAIALVALLAWAVARASALHRSPNAADVGREGFAELSYPWMRTERLEQVRSLYHDIEVVDTKHAALGKCLLLNDEVQFCSAEEAKYHELIVHFGVQYLPDATPRRILIVGGGDCMVLREVMKYPKVETVTVVELDDMITRVSEKHFGASRMTGNDRVNWSYGNVRANVKKMLQTNRKTFDMIIVDTTETTDHNAETDTKAFFEDARDLLAPEGVLVKNGDACESILRATFEYTLSYGFESKTHEARYTFVLASSFDFKRKIVTTGKWFAHNVRTVAYNPDKHFDALRWTDTFRQTLLDRIVAEEKPDEVQVYAQPVEVRRN